MRHMQQLVGIFFITLVCARNKTIEQYYGSTDFIHSTTVDVGPPQLWIPQINIICDKKEENF
ncbi:hypothetical protein QTP88_002037 [Uroleucon formosanum]